jgi:hypothetical protein
MRQVCHKWQARVEREALLSGYIHIGTQKENVYWILFLDVPIIVV